jgi:hypothetical protein
MPDEAEAARLRPLVDEWRRQVCREGVHAKQQQQQEQQQEQGSSS